MIKVKKIVTYAMAAAMIGGTLAGTGSVGVSAATKQTYKYNNVMSNTNYKQMYEDYLNQFLKAPEITEAKFTHGSIITLNLLTINFSEVNNAKSYDVMISKDDNFKVTKTYTTDTNSFSIKTDNDDFLTSSYHGRYVKVRANYGYGMHGNWSEAKMIGCDKLHLNQDFDNVSK